MSTGMAVPALRRSAPGRRTLGLLAAIVVLVAIILLSLAIGTRGELQQAIAPAT